jgi:hypothetical protein
MARYALEDYNISYGTESITGLAEEAFSISFNGKNTMTIGSKGEGSYNITSDNSATVTINLLQTSSSNAYLSGLLNIAKQNNGVASYPLVINDSNGTTIYSCTDAVIESIPDTSRGRETGTNGWIILCTNLLGVEGGN